MKIAFPLILAVVAALAAIQPASATGKMKCDAPQASWKSVDALKAQLAREGWAVRKAKVDGGCYEVYGADPEGRKVEAYFHPVSFKKLLVSRRGQVLFRAQ